ncbi:MAG: hypothetical protein ABSF26_03865 [Thermoguttaceae bacterium]
MKRLIVISVIHTAADLGSLAESVRARHVERFGAEGWERRQRAVEELWKDTRRAIDALSLDFRLLRLYQDGLPVCGQEERMVRELAAVGSLNHQLLLELMGRGAALVGTEDPQLLIREYQQQRRRFEAPAGGATAGGPMAAGCSPGEEAELLAARDRFIAARIAATLQEGETGLLFLGAAHRLDAIETLAASGIQVQTLRRAG